MAARARSSTIDEVELAALDACGAWCRRALAMGRRWRRSDELGTVTKSGPYDLATQADRAIEAYLRAAIGRRFPDHGVLGEEDGVTGSAGPWTWVIDPIDGTFNFATGMTACGTTFALLHDGRPLVGAVTDLGAAEALVAGIGLGTRRWEAGRGWVPATIAHDGAARVFLELGAERLDEWMLGWLAAVAGTRDTVPRLIGSAAVALAAVALHGGCFVGVGLKAWDVAGGYCLAQASGRDVRWWDDGAPGVHVLVGDHEVVRDLESPVLELVARWRERERGDERAPARAQS